MGGGGQRIWSFKSLSYTVCGSPELHETPSLSSHQTLGVSIYLREVFVVRLCLFIWVIIWLYSPDWPRTYCVAQDTLKLLVIFLSQPSKCFNYENEAPHLPGVSGFYFLIPTIVVGFFLLFVCFFLFLYPKDLVLSLPFSQFKNVISAVSAMWVDKKAKVLWFLKNKPLFCKLL